MSREETLNNLAKAGAIGPPAYLLTSASTDAVLSRLNIKNPLSQAKTAILSAIEGSKAGRTVLKAGGQAAGIIGDYVIDTVVGGMAIGEAAKDTSMDSGQKGYTITGEVVGIAANIGVNVFTGAALSGAGAAVGGAAVGGAAVGGAAAGGAAAGGTVAAAGTTAGGTLAAGAATGPGVIIAIAIVALQILGGILDSFAGNPFQAMYNKDLKKMNEAYNSALKKAYLDIGLNWPIEVKPDLIGITFGTPENIDKYRKYINEYYTDKGLITTSEFVEDWELLLNLRKMARNTRKYIVDENDNIIGIRDPVSSAADITSDVESNVLIMFALAARIAKMKKETRQKPSIIKQFVETYYIAIIFWTILLLLIIFLSIFFLLI